MTSITREEARKVAIIHSMRMFFGRMPTKEEVELALELTKEEEE
tara:strand:+ start:228 stop:359 length:132 start_codon:yes stop_codon:yes gene_type:complete